MRRPFGVKSYVEAFAYDGSLRDIYILSISRKEWSKLLNLVKSDEFRTSFWINGETRPIPSDVNGLFYRQMDTALLLEIDVGGVKLNCHFFVENEIELDLDPRQVNSDEKVEAVLAFMSRLGRELEKEVLMTAENMRTVVIFRYDPSTDKVTYSS